MICIWHDRALIFPLCLANKWSVVNSKLYSNTTNWYHCNPKTRHGSHAFADLSLYGMNIYYCVFFKPYYCPRSTPRNEWYTFVSCATHTIHCIILFFPLWVIWRSIYDVDSANIIRNRQQNLWDGQCVSYWWPPDWFGYSHELYIDIWFTFNSD